MLPLAPRVRWLLSTTLLAWLPLSATGADTDTLRLAVLKFGTANWEADVIKHHKLDRKNGFKLIVTPLVSKQATVVALQGGSAQMIPGDWIWVSSVFIHRLR